MTHRTNPRPSLPRFSNRRHGKLSLLILVCVLTGLGVMLLTLLLGPQPLPPHPWEDQPVPSATLTPLLNVDEPQETSDLEGKVTVINFWGPWCQPCLLEFPDLLSLRKKFRDEEDFRFVSIAAGTQLTPGPSGPQENTEYLKAESQMLMAKYNTDLPIYVDLHGSFRLALNNLGEFSGYPTTMLVGRDGKIVNVWLGYVPTLETELSKMIREELSSSSDN